MAVGWWYDKDIKSKRNGEERLGTCAGSYPTACSSTLPVEAAVWSVGVWRLETYLVDSSDRAI